MGKELYPFEVKLAAVQYVLDGHHTLKQAAEKYGITTCYPVEKWVNLYRYHGEDGLKSRNNWNRRQCFTGEYKLNVLRYMEEHHLSYTQTAAVFCIDVVTVSKWAKRYREEGAQAFLRERSVMKNPSERKAENPSTQETKQLQEENLRLRMENAYLKKLNALIWKKEESAKKNG